MPADIHIHRTTSVRKCLGCGGPVRLTATPTGWTDALGAKVPTAWAPGSGYCPRCGIDYVEVHDGVMVRAVLAVDEWEDDEITRVGDAC